MENHELYKSAMDKITPSEHWQQDTLQKLAEARAQMAAEAENPAPKKKTIPFAKRAVPVVAAAAVMAVLVVPAAMRLPQGGKSGELAAAFDSKAAPEALESMNEAAAAAEDSGEPAPATLFRNAAAFPLEAGEMVSLRPQDTDPCPESAEEPGPLQSAKTVKLPAVQFYQDKDSAVPHLVYTIRSLEDAATQNPTWNLPADQLPQALPVWQAHAGPENGRLLAARMEKAAELLGLVYLPDAEEPLPKDYPNPELWPELACGSLMDPALYDPEQALSRQPEGALVWKVQARQNALSLFGNSSRPKPEENPDFEREAVRRSLETFGPMLGTDTLAYSPGQTDFWYDPGLAEDDIGQKLLDYSFRRLEVSGAYENGDSEFLTVSSMPSSPLLGQYPLLSLEDAKAALETKMQQNPPLAIFADSPEQKIENLSSDDVIAWEIEYFEDFLSPTILPLYHFVVKVPVEASELAAQSGEAISETDLAVADYYISALPKELCSPSEYHSN